MKKDQQKAKPYGNRIRVSGYFEPELVAEIEQIISSMPYRVTLSGFLETAVRNEVERAKAGGLIKPQK